MDISDEEIIEEHQIQKSEEIKEYKIKKKPELQFISMCKYSNLV